MLHKPTGLLHYVLVMAICLLSFCSSAMDESDSLSIRQRKLRMAVIGAGGISTSYYLLNELWYKDYPRSKMHSFNDNDEWLQMDKVGHFTTSYYLGGIGYHAFKYAGFSEDASLWIGGNTGLIYLTGIELLDGKSAQWGFSWGDQIANSSGALLFILQQKLWNEQRIVMKFSYTNSPYAMLNSDQLGRNFQQRVLKDYNGQTYWTSYNIASFMASDAGFPKWLNIAIGYGATQMTTAKNSVDSVNNFQRAREFYLSFDADLNRVRWPRKWMKTTARILSFIKIPSPTFEMRSDGKVKMHALFF